MTAPRKPAKAAPMACLSIGYRDYLMPADKAMYSTKLFAEKVMPHLRNMFPEYADDDRFWCHPIAKRAVPGSLPAAPTTAPGAPARNPVPAE